MAKKTNKKGKAAHKIIFTKKCKPTGCCEPELFAKSWAEKAEGVQGWALTEACLDCCSSITVTSFSNSGSFKDMSAK